MALPADRAQLVSSAVSFLVDPQTASSPLAQRIAFLESKGLNQNEIQLALQQANNSAAPGGPPPLPRAAVGPYGSSMSPYAGGFEYQRDWRDWFVMAVVGGGVSWLAVKLAQKFLVPHLQPPTETDLEASQKALEAKYDEAALLLQTLRESTDAVATSLDEQRAEIDKELEEVREAVKEMREGEKKRDEWARNIGRQVDEMAKSLPGLLDKQASAQSSSLSDLQTELRSLKSLLIARRPTGPTGLPSSSSISSSSRNLSSSSATTPSSSGSLPFAIKPPGLPAWQLKGSSSASASSSGTATPTSSAAPAATSSDSTADKDPSASGVLVEKPVEDERKQDAEASTSADGPEAPSSSSTT
ncbi:hypothetical protein JCM10908_002398 [Rhodotorula pacifica]|uniref:uncharacterized protein n=1 Tax=Rhodotorula pacifica TaxID=1495444 RepID=UPI003176F74A